MADAYKDIAAAHPEALQDLVTQTSMFTKLYDMDNVIITPHSSGASQSSGLRAEEIFVENLAAYMAGGTLRNEVSG
jgi:phosphoglycerate dehydrogenase-like enzyme